MQYDFRCAVTTQFPIYARYFRSSRGSGKKENGRGRGGYGFRISRIYRLGLISVIRAAKQTSAISEQLLLVTEQTDTIAEQLSAVAEQTAPLAEQLSSMVEMLTYVSGILIFFVVVILCKFAYSFFNIFF